MINTFGNLEMKLAWLQLDETGAEIVSDSTSLSANYQFDTGNTLQIQRQPSGSASINTTFYDSNTISGDGSVFYDLSNLSPTIFNLTGNFAYTRVYGIVAATTGYHMLMISSTGSGLYEAFGVASGLLVEKRLPVATLDQLDGWLITGAHTILEIQRTGGLTDFMPFEIAIIGSTGGTVT